MVGNPDVNQVGTERIGTEKSACRTGSPNCSWITGKKAGHRCQGSDAEKQRRGRRKTCVEPTPTRPDEPTSNRPLDSCSRLKSGSLSRLRI